MSDMTSIWGWMVQDDTGRWVAIRADIPDLGMTRLVAGSVEKAESLRGYAVKHRAISGKPVCLVRYDTPTILENLP
jgi:hypothetical protein